MRVTCQVLIDGPTTGVKRQQISVGERREVLSPRYLAFTSLTSSSLLSVAPSLLK